MSLTPEHKLLRDIYVEYYHSPGFKYKSDIELILGPSETEKAQIIADILKDVFETRLAMPGMNASERVIAEVKFVRLHHELQDLLKDE